MSNFLTFFKTPIFSWLLSFFLVFPDLVATLNIVLNTIQNKAFTFRYAFKFNTDYKTYWVYKGLSTAIIWIIKKFKQEFKIIVRLFLYRKVCVKFIKLSKNLLLLNIVKYHIQRPFKYDKLRRLTKLSSFS